MIKKTDIIWDMDLSAWQGQILKVETHEGIIRLGRCTGLVMADFEYEGLTCKVRLQYPKTIIMDGDPIASIDLSTIKRVRLVTGNQNSNA
jgi:hypothetical protein